MSPLRSASALIATILASALAGPAAAAAERPFVLLDPAALAQLKQRATANDPELKPALDALRAKADDLLTKKPPSVTDKPDPLPVPGDKHDYMSLARYYWPNPNTPDGLPYVNRDGDSNNKGINAFDSPRKDRLCFSVRDLALAYHLTGDEKYAAGAAKYLRAWFLDGPTRMNPNLNHGQFVPGVTEGRCYGIIETRWFVFLTDAVQLLEGSPAWPEQDRDGFRSWMNEYLDWLLTSKLGKEEAATRNNHGQWYDYQIVGLARYLGRDDIVRQIAADEGPKRIAKQVQPDGSLPEEIKRTRSLHYSLFAIEPWMEIARMSKPLGIDLYAWKSEDGRSIQSSLAYLAPYLLGEKEWTYQQLGDTNYAGYAALYRHAAQAYDEPRFAEVAKKLQRKDAAPDLHALLGW